MAPQRRHGIVRKNNAIIGSRSGVPLFDGKSIRRDSRGKELLDDYFSVSEYSDGESSTSSRSVLSKNSDQKTKNRNSSRSDFIPESQRPVGKRKKTVIGSRSGRVLYHGKTFRKNSLGKDNLDDYFTDDDDDAVSTSSLLSFAETAQNVHNDSGRFTNSNRDSFASPKTSKERPQSVNFNSLPSEKPQKSLSHHILKSIPSAIETDEVYTRVSPRISSVRALSGLHTTVNSLESIARTSNLLSTSIALGQSNPSRNLDISKVRTRLSFATPVSPSSKVTPTKRPALHTSETSNNGLSPSKSNKQIAVSFTDEIGTADDVDENFDGFRLNLSKRSDHPNVSKTADRSVLKNSKSLTNFLDEKNNSKSVTSAVKKNRDDGTQRLSNDGYVPIDVSSIRRNSQKPVQVSPKPGPSRSKTSATNFTNASSFTRSNSNEKSKSKTSEVVKKSTKKPTERQLVGEIADTTPEKSFREVKSSQKSTGTSSASPKRIKLKDTSIKPSNGKGNSKSSKKEKTTVRKEKIQISKPQKARALIYNVDSDEDEAEPEEGEVERNRNRGVIPLAEKSLRKTRTPDPSRSMHYASKLFDELISSSPPSKHTRSAKDSLSSPSQHTRKINDSLSSSKHPRLTDGLSSSECAFKIPSVSTVLNNRNNSVVDGPSEDNNIRRRKSKRLQSLPHEPLLIENNEGDQSSSTDWGPKKGAPLSSKRKSPSPVSSPSLHINKENKQRNNTRTKVKTKNKKRRASPDLEKENSPWEESPVHERPKRQRSKPLEYWRNERILYRRDSSGCPSFVGVDPGLDPRLSEFHIESQRHHRQKAAKKSRDADNDNKKNNSPVEIDEAVMEDEGFDRKEQQPIVVINPTTLDEVLVDCIKVKDSHVPFSMTGDVPKSTDKIIITKPLRQPAFSAGTIEILSKVEKGMHFLRNDTMVFYVKQGLLEVTIHDTRIIVKDGDLFFVPQGNKYNLRNMADPPVQLVFFQHRNE